MLQPGGPNLKLVDAGNGKLTVSWDSTGNPAFDDAEAECVMSLLIELPGWFGDRAKKRRSQIHQVKTRGAGTAGQLEQYAKDALQPAIDDGRLQSVEVTANAVGNGYLLLVEYVTGSGQKRSINVPLSV